MITRMEGSLPDLGLHGGFQSPYAYHSMNPGTDLPIITRGMTINTTEDDVAFQSLLRGEFTGDVSQILRQLGTNMAGLTRAVTSTMSAFPARENLEAEAKVLFPLETPIRNMLPRRPGAGTASQWRQLISAGGGYGAATTTAGGTATATGAPVSVQVVSSAGIVAGNYVYIDSGANQEFLLVSAVADSTHITLLITVNHVSGSAVVKGNIEPGSQAGLIRTFFAETGAPAEHTSAYANQSFPYKLLGTFGQVTGFAMAAGATFQNQLATEKTNAIRNLMLNEENALLNGDSTSTAAPWGDGTNALAFSGLNTLTATANGTPSNQVQSAVGPLTTQHIDFQLFRLWNLGAQGIYMVMSGLDAMSLVHVAEGNGSIIRVAATSNGETVLGVKVTGYVNPLTGELVSVYTSRFQPQGTILFGSQRLPDGSPSADVEVLPQVQLPELAPNENIQGYVAQEIAPSTTAPSQYPFIVTAFEVLRMKSAQHFAKSTGVGTV